MSNSQKHIVPLLIKTIENSYTLPEEIRLAVSLFPKESRSANLIVEELAANQRSPKTRSANILEALALRASRENNAHDFLEIMMDLVDESQTNPSKEVWERVNAVLYTSNIKFDVVQTSEQRDRWIASTPKEYWKTDSAEEALKMAFNAKLWSEVENILAQGVSPDIEMGLSLSLYSPTNQKHPVPLLAHAPCPKAAQILLAYQANPLLEVKGGGSILEWAEKRSENSFEHNERRPTLAVIREAFKKEVVKDTSDTSKEKKYKVLLDVIHNAKSWTDVQQTVNTFAKEAQEYRSPLGENYLQLLILEHPEWASNLMRMKVSDKNWWHEKNSVGADASHYYTLTAPPYVSGSKSRIAADEKLSNLVNQFKLPHHEEEWLDWNQTLLSLQKSFRSKSGFNPVLFPKETVFCGREEESLIKAKKLLLSNPDKLSAIATPWLEVFKETEKSSISLHRTNCVLTNDLWPGHQKTFDVLAAYKNKKPTEDVGVLIWIKEVILNNEREDFKIESTVNKVLDLGVGWSSVQQKVLSQQHVFGQTHQKHLEQYQSHQTDWKAKTQIIERLSLMKNVSTTHTTPKKARNVL